jgi:molybdopterin synthase catalytic subunit
MKFLLLSVFMAIFTVVSGSIGVVESFSGNVKVKNESSIKKNNVVKGLEIKSGDLITTSKSSNAVLKLNDGSNVILDELSSIFFGDTNSAEQKDGKIFYKITSRDAANSLKIKTPFAIIGIKGTTFVINSDKGNEGVALKEGLIGVESIKEQFALYRKEVLAQYNEYVSEQMSEFEKFKNVGKKPEPEMTKQFDLKAGNVISFSGNEVKESGWSQNDDAEFEHFEKIMNAEFEQIKSTNTQDMQSSKDDNDEIDDSVQEPSKNSAVDAMKESMKF